MDNTALLLARLQFGITLTYHFWFVALTLGLSVLVAIMETIYVLRNKTIYKMMAQFWGKLFLINYIAGVMAGIVQEFQFGMNWSEYSRFAGGVLGVPLAFEALTAFCVEATFIGIWTYGWTTVSRYVHVLVIWLVALASNYSAFWILAANSFMQNPVGYRVQDGRLELGSLAAIALNPYLMYQYSHTVLAGFLTASVFMMAVSSYYLLKQQHDILAKKSFKMGVVCAGLTGVLVFFSGHIFTQYLVKEQPMKVAAMEALWETADSAPFIVSAMIHEDEQKNSAEISLTGMLSVLATNHYHSRIIGMKELQQQFTETYGTGKYIPPVMLLFWSFRIKVAIGIMVIVVSTVSLWIFKRRRLVDHSFLLYCIILLLPLIYLGHLTGWVIGEVGRQPWLIYGLQLTEDGVSKVVPIGQLWFTFLSLNFLYILMAVLVVALMLKSIIAGPDKSGS